LSSSRFAWGWERPSAKSFGLDHHNYINWKFDKVLAPVYDFSKTMGHFSQGGPAINYNYNDWNWGNWSWLNDV